VLVEGNFDVLALHARGLDQVVAPLGTAFTSHQAKLIKRYAPEVVVLFDGDEAGRKATLGMRGPAREAGLSVKVGKLDAGVDPDDLAREHGVEAVERLIKGSRSMLEHLIEGTLGSHAAWNGPEELLGRVREVVGFIAEENDPNLREMAKTYADDIASKLTLKGRSPESLLALERLIRHGLRGGDTEIRQMERELRSGPDGKAVGAGSRSRPNSEQMALAALGALFDFPELFDDSGVEDALAALEGEVALTVASVRQLWDRKKTLQGAELLDLLPEAIHSFAVGRLAAPHFSKLELARAELVKNTEKLRRRALTGDKAVKVQELTRAQSQGDVETEDELLRELERVAREKRRMS
jgi:DNA primase